MGGAHVDREGSGISVFLKILRFALREPASMDGSDFWFPHLALWL